MPSDPRFLPNAGTEAKADCIGNVFLRRQEGPIASFAAHVAVCSVSLHAVPVRRTNRRDTVTYYAIPKQKESENSLKMLHRSRKTVGNLQRKKERSEPAPQIWKLNRLSRSRWTLPKPRVHTRLGFCVFCLFVRLGNVRLGCPVARVDPKGFGRNDSGRFGNEDRVGHVWVHSVTVLLMLDVRHWHFWTRTTVLRPKNEAVLCRENHEQGTVGEVETSRTYSLRALFTNGAGTSVHRQFAEDVPRRDQRISTLEYVQGGGLYALAKKAATC